VSIAAVPGAAQSLARREPHAEALRQESARGKRDTRHELAAAGEDSQDMHQVGSALVTTATVPLALGLVGDVYVVITKIVGTPTAGLIAGSLALVPATAEFAVGINNASVSTLNLTVQVVDAALEPLPRRF
jgi:hypothetical protein